MATQYKNLGDKHIRFIEEQKIFFVGTAAAEGRINVSPKGMDSFKVISSERVAWLNVTGSGNESSAHVQINPRMTIMFYSFEGEPLILRLYGSAKVVHKTDQTWEGLYSLFKPLPGARQIFDLAIELVQTSCGMAVPNFAFVSERELLSDWATKKGEGGLREYREAKNQFSLDGFPSNIVLKDGG